MSVNNTRARGGGLVDAVQSSPVCFSALPVAKGVVVEQGRDQPNCNGYSTEAQETQEQDNKQCLPLEQLLADHLLQLCCDPVGLPAPILA